MDPHLPAGLPNRATAPSGGAGYGRVLEVELKRAMPDMREFAMLAVRGRLEFGDDPGTMLMFRLKDAVLAD